MIHARHHLLEIVERLGRGYGAFRGMLLYEAGGFPTAVVVADLDRDGVPDLISANSGSQDLTVLIGKGDGSFDSPNIS